MSNFSSKHSTLFTLVISLILLCGSTCTAQEKSKKQQDDEDKLASIFGKFSIPDGYKLDFVWKEFTPVILEKVELDLPPFPEDWPNKTIEQRNEWLKQFSESKEGEKFQAKQQAALEARKVFQVEIEEDGSYTVYDVPQGDYVIEGWIVKEEKDNDKVRFRLDAFGEFNVGEVNEVELGNMELLFHRVFQSGDNAPELNAKTFDGKSLKLSELKGNYVLIDYWASTFGSSEFMLPQLQKVQNEIADKYKIKILSISLDEDKSLAEAFVKKHKVNWLQAHAGDWEHEAVKAFGVRSAPSFWLIDPKGNIALTNGQIMQRYSVPQSLAEVLEDNITGKNAFAPPPVEDGAVEKESEGNDQDK